MSDPLTCPECEGSGEEHLGPLVLACRFCCGRGEVGGDHEPAEDPPEPEGFGPPVGRSVPVRESGLCATCLGAGVVASLGCDEQGCHPGTVIEVPCPSCVSRKQ